MTHTKNSEAWSKGGKSPETFPVRKEHKKVHNMGN